MERMAIIQGPAHEETPIGTANGFVALFAALLLLAGGAWLLYTADLGLRPPVGSVRARHRAARSPAC